MTASDSEPSEAPRSIDAVMRRVSAASHLFELGDIRFVDCSFSYVPDADGTDREFRIGIAEQEVTLEESALRVAMLFEFVAPSPFGDDESERDKRVSIRARMELHYTPQRDRGEVTEDEADVFGRVNGIYNAWPYLREYVHSSLRRLGLPAFELPLLRAGAAADLAGLIDPQHDGWTAE